MPQIPGSFAQHLTALGFVFGLLVGSFLNVVIHRLPREMSIVRPRSRCPSCGGAIAPWHNVPVLSWLLLRGRCAHCRAPISARYPAVELATAVLFACAARLDGFSIALPFHLFFLAAMICVTLIDFDFQIIPDEITASGAILGFACAALTGRIVDGAIGAVVGSGLLWLIGAAYFALRKVEGMGGGDVKLAVMLGAFLGWKGVLLTLFASSLVGAVVGIALIRLKGGDRQTRIPFGTFLAPAAVFVLFAGRPLIDWYAGFFGR